MALFDHEERRDFTETERRILAAVERHPHGLPAREVLAFEPNAVRRLIRNRDLIRVERQYGSERIAVFRRSRISPALESEDAA